LTIAVRPDQPSANHVSEGLDHRDLQNKLTREVQKMPPMRKKIFELSRYESKTYKEIAQLLSLSEKTVENHITLALRQLRRAFILFILFFFS
jgi:RNA polymerase sigma factor (sigma-70 family)